MWWGYFFYINHLLRQMKKSSIDNYYDLLRFITSDYESITSGIFSFNTINYLADFQYFNNPLFQKKHFIFALAIGTNSIGKRKISLWETILKRTISHRLIQAKKVEITKHLIRPRIGWIWKVKQYQEGCKEVFGLKSKSTKHKTHAIGMIG